MLLQRALSNGIDESVGEFDGERMRTLNAGVLMISIVALISVPVMALVGRGETIPGTLLFLLCMVAVALTQSRRRPFVAALTATLFGLVVLGLQSYSLDRDFGVHFWLLALILFPLLFFPKETGWVPIVLGALITLAFSVFAIREQGFAGGTDGSVATQILTAVVIFGLSVTMRRQTVRAEEAYEVNHDRLKRQAANLLEHQNQLEEALAAADEARRILDLRVEERTADLQLAHDRLSRELLERGRMESERRALEAKLHHAQRMESIGQLAGGVAHDFNNLLTVIRGNLDLAIEAKRANPETRREWLEDARSATERASSVTGQLLAYSRKQAVVLETFDPGRVVLAAEPMIRRAAGERVRLELDVAESLGLIRLGKGQLEQILMNLALNACDAMPDGGELKIELSEVVSAAAEADGPHIALRVHDTGTGIDPAVVDRVFEPFFTTKESGKGTGLGLAVLHGIVTGHEGVVTVDSTPGKGSVFSVYLPVVANENVEIAPVKGDMNRSMGRGEKILVVEDEPSVRRFTSSLLERLGYDVVACATGKDALDVVRAGLGPLHLLVTDVVMPGLQGPELASALLEIRPETPVLFVSGYTAPNRLRNLQLSGTRSFLQKPFSTVELAKHVRGLIDGATQAAS